VLGQVDDAEAVREVASRVVNSLCQSMQLAGGRTARIGASVVIAICRAGKETLEDLLKKADTALYVAKRDGKNTFREADASEG
jgi:diguanylate cyclase (GGDEF)-like protein